LKQKYKKPVVVIIDEYDKPILDLINKPEEMEAVRESLQTFYSVLKSEEANLRLVFITGLYKFTEMSMFSTLNNLIDISLDLSAGTLVGYTESEIKEYFGDHIQALKAKMDIIDDDILMNKLREKYNGYRFGLDTANGKVSEQVYNPFEMNYVFDDLQVNNKWILSGSASMLSKKMIERGYRYESMLFLTTYLYELKTSYPVDVSERSLMYYGGYATIDKYNKDTNQVFLKIPNKSISADLARNYLKSMLETKFKQVDIVHMKVREFERVAREVHDVMTLTPINEMGSKIEEIIKSFENVLNHYTHESEAISSEREFRNIIDSMLKLKFHNVAHEVETNNDRIDTVIIEKSRIFILQYKYKEKASTALKQIKEKEYYAQYLNTNLPILLLGISLREKKDESKTRYIDISYDIKNSSSKCK
jgi:hypothetical protein